MTMLRKGDRVIASNVTGTIESVAAGVATFTNGFVSPEDMVTLRCSVCGHEEVELFGSFTGKAYCVQCAVHVQEDVTDVRRDPRSLCDCVCGETLDIAKSEGTWTIDTIACEYRTCLHCKSTRAYAPKDVLPAPCRLASCASELPEHHHLFRSFLDALEKDPPTRTARITRNGVVLAEAFPSINDVLVWRVMPPQPEER